MPIKAYTTLALLSLTALPLAAQQPAPPLESKPIAIDREQAYVGKRVFRVVNEGADAGLITVHSRFNEAGQYLLHDLSDSDALGIREEIFAVLDGDSFAPIRNQVHARMGATYIDVNWGWQGLDASSQIEIYNFDSGEHRFLERPKTMPAATLTRASALYLVNAMDLAEGKVIEFNWFNTMNGQIAPISYTVTGSQEITVPAGTYDSFVVVQEGGLPGNTIYVSKDKPRRIVRFDVTGMDMQLELMPEG